MIRWENGPAEQAIIKASLADLDRLGTKQWCGYSFSWLANRGSGPRWGEGRAGFGDLLAAFCLQRIPLQRRSD